jgi:archaellum biogenesis ATPase FlaH|tara:strand:- start:345 stop:599 length:255 start_codon:yes stop_codon:yes gene_type:complete
MASLPLNPFVDDLSDLSTNELSDKINDLSKKYFMTNNLQVQDQIRAVLEMYRVEAASRQASESINQTVDKENGENSLDNLINIS